MFLTIIICGFIWPKVPELLCGLGNREIQIHSTDIPFFQEAYKSCLDDNPFRVALPILESRGVGPDILVSTVIAAPAVSGTDPEAHI